MIMQCAACAQCVASHNKGGVFFAATPGGVRVVTLVPGKAFASGGIEVGDVVKAVNGVPVNSVAAANQAIAAAPTGVPVPVVVIDRNTGVPTTLFVVF